MWDTQVTDLMELVLELLNGIFLITMLKRENIAFRHKLSTHDI